MPDLRYQLRAVDCAGEMDLVAAARPAIPRARPGRHHIGSRTSPHSLRRCRILRGRRQQRSRLRLRDPRPSRRKRRGHRAAPSSRPAASSSSSRYEPVGRSHCSSIPETRSTAPISTRRPVPASAADGNRRSGRSGSILRTHSMTPRQLARAHHAGARSMTWARRTIWLALVLLITAGALLTLWVVGTERGAAWVVWHGRQLRFRASRSRAYEARCSVASRSATCVAFASRRARVRIARDRLDPSATFAAPLEFDQVTASR